MPEPPFILRPYAPADEAAAIELWRRTWQQAYPVIDFDQRVDWWRTRWREEILPTATVMVAEQDAGLMGFVTVDPTGYLDQLVVAPENWASGMAEALLDEAKRLAPGGIALHVNKDNHRAVRFYEKHGFVIQGDDRNVRSGRPIHKMSWRPGVEASAAANDP